MASSLSSQLANIGHPDKDRLLASSSTSSSRPSFLFPARVAASLSNTDVHSLAYNGFLALLSTDARFERFEKPVFGEKAKGTDRSLLTKEENEKLDRTVIAPLLRLLAKGFLLKSTGKVLEWLIRRFRINEFNVDDLVALILPYHETPQFAQMLQVLKLDNSPKFASLQGVKASLQPLPRHVLLTSLLKSADLLRFIAGLLKAYSVEDALYPVLISWWTGTLLGYLERSSTGGSKRKGATGAEAETAIFLPVLVENMKPSVSSADLQLASFIILSRFVQRAGTQLNAEALELLFISVTHSISRKTGLGASVVEQQREKDTLEAGLSTLVILAETQDAALELAVLPKKATSNLLRCSSSLLVETVVSLASAYSATRFLKPFLASLAKLASEGEEKSQEILLQLLAPVTTPQQLTDVALEVLLDAAMAGEADAPFSEELIKIIDSIAQRSSDDYYKACETKSKTSALAKERVKKLQAAVSGYGLFATSLTNSNGPDSAMNGQHRSDADLALALASSDAEARAGALQQILETAAASTSDDEAISSVLKNIIFDRLSDTAAPVAAVLLVTESGRQLLARISKQPVDSARILEVCTAVVNSAEAPRATVLHHFTYLTTTFLASVTDASVRGAVLQNVVWPKLLATKAHAKTGKLVWAQLDSQQSDGKWSLLRGIDALERDSASGKEDGVAFNEQLVALLVQNLQNNGNKEKIIDTLVAQLDPAQAGSIPATARILSLLILSKYLQSQAPASIRSSIAQRILSIAPLDVSLVSASSDALPSLANLQAAYAKPSSGKTYSRLFAEVQLCALLSIGITNEADGQWPFLLPATSLDGSVKNFCSLAVSAYKIAHTTGISPALSTSILKTLFGKALGDRVLSFFASIYTHSSVPLSLRLAALRDSAVYLEAVKGAGAADVANDFQVVLPSLLVALVSGEKAIRTQVLEVLARISEVAKNVKGDQKIYGFDVYYGSENSKDLQYLDLAQVVQYIDILLASRAELLLSGSHLQTIHASQLDDPSAASKKKRGAFAHAVFCYLVSHAYAWQNLPARAALLDSLRGLQDSSRLDLFRPFLLSGIKSEDAQGEEVSAETADLYAQTLLDAYATVPKGGWDENAFSTLMALLESQNLSVIASALRKHSRSRIEAGVFAAAAPVQRLTILEKLVNSLRVAPASEMPAVRALIYSLRVDSDTLAAYLDKLRLGLLPRSSSDGSAKKSRTSLASDASAPGASKLAELSTLLEAVDMAKVEGSKVLLAVMLDTLGALVDLSASGVNEIAYYSQLVMTALGSVAGRLATENAKVDDSVRISPVLEIIRISNNPQSSNQALSLVADLVSLVPEQVVQNIMPIFTFMGSNVLQRDDAYSSRVVDKTIECIVPALVKHHRRRSHSKEQVVSDLADVLSVFADAANHVPRHRRNRLFIRLVEVLGAKDFLAPVAGLLIDKVASKLVKTQDPGLLSLPSALVAHFAADVQLAAFQQLLGDLLKKVQELNSPDGESASRNSTPMSIDSPALPISTSRKTVLATLTFLNIAIATKTLASKVDTARSVGSLDLDVSVQELIKTCISFHTIAPSRLSSNDLAQLTKSIEQFILASGRLLSVAAFAEVIIWSLDNEDTRVVSVAIDLLAVRLRTVKHNRRDQLTTAVSAGIRKLDNYLQRPSGRFDQQRALQSLRVITVAPTDQELPTLTETLSTVLSVAASGAEKNVVAQSVAFIQGVIPHIKARVIPSVAKIISLASSLALQHASEESSNTSKTIIAGSLATIDTLFLTVPTFVSSQLSSVLALCVNPRIRAVATADPQGKVTIALSGLVSATTKKVQARPLFNALVQLWTQTDKSDSTSILGVLDILLRALKQCNPTTVTEIHKTIFGPMLDILDIRRTATFALEAVQEVEAAATVCFMQMVLKLNESTFRPLFLRLYDWAVIDMAAEESGAIARKTTLFRVVERMLSQLKGIAVPYYAYMLEQAVESLTVVEGTLNMELWEAVTGSLRLAFKHDSTGFWTSARASKLVTPIVNQVDSPAIADPRFMRVYHALLASFSQAIESYEQVLHDVVRGYLQKTRSEDEAVQLAAILSLQKMWDSGIETSLATHSAESMPFLVEALETGGEVERATKDLLARMNEDEGQDEESDSEDDSDESEEDE